VSVRAALAGWLRQVATRQAPEDPVAREWEWYARDWRRAHGRAPAAAESGLGDEWNRPELVGADVPADQLVTHLARTVFEPFLGEDVDTLLEIGAGGGRFTAVFAPQVRRLIACDVAPTMVRLLGERFRKVPRVEAVLLGRRGLARFGDASIDAVFSYDVFVHLTPWTIQAYLDEIARLLKPGGRAILHHANTLSELGWQRFRRDVEREKRGQPADSRFTPMTAELFAAMAGRAGLVVERCITDVVRRDAITLLRRPAGAPVTPAVPPSGS
jgi:SAM-dependent methyltransferase